MNFHSLVDSSPAPITILQELRERRPDLLERDDFHVFIDGGIRRGTDILKALCLGARAVGLGRPFLYANGVWGEEGARRVIQSESTSPEIGSFHSCVDEDCSQ
jgi:L-lactate dehydrogenase (cytochrome)